LESFISIFFGEVGEGDEEKKNLEEKLEKLVKRNKYMNK
jgi:hypothetical protein